MEGGAMSTFLWALLWFFQIKLAIDVIMEKTVMMSQDYQFRSLDTADELPMGERGFEMAFGFLDKPLPREYGSWKLTYHTNSGKVKDVTDPRGFKFEDVVADSSYEYTRCKDK